MSRELPETDSGRPTEPPAVSPVIGELRVPGDEAQLTRVLGAVCATSPEVARAFVEELLALATVDPTFADRSASVEVPGSVTCHRQGGLYRAGRGMLARERKLLGTADLVFTGSDPGFRLVCELKINAPYRSDQLRDYLDSGAFVIGIVRAAGRIDDAVTANPRWLGEVTWADLAPRLEELPLDARYRAAWLELLRVLRDDGDFDPAPPKLSTVHDRELIEAVGQVFVEELREAVRVRSSGSTFGEAMRMRRAPRRGRGAWIKVEDEDHVHFVLGAQNAGSRIPRVIVRWQPTERVLADPRFRPALDELISTHGFRERSTGEFRIKRDVTLRDEDVAAAAAAGAWEMTKPVVSLGLLDELTDSAS